MKTFYKKILELYKKYEEIINYVIVGGFTTIVSLGSYYACVLTFLNPEVPIELQTANIISWICAVTFAYFTNRKFVFKSKNEKKFKEAVNFFLSRATTLLMDMAFMFIMVTWLGWNDKISKIVVQVIILVTNYLLSKIFVFKKK